MYFRKVLSYVVLSYYLLFTEVLSVLSYESTIYSCTVLVATFESTFVRKYESTMYFRTFESTFVPSKVLSYAPAISELAIGYTYCTLYTYVYNFYWIFMKVRKYESTKSTKVLSYEGTLHVQRTRTCSTRVALVVLLFAGRPYGKWRTWPFWSRSPVSN